MKMEYEFTEIFKLKEMLDKEKIPYEFEDESFKTETKVYTAYHLCCYDGKENPKDNRYISVIQSFGSYGREKDLLEIMGLLTTKEQQTDSVLGYLTAENVFKRIKKHLKEK